MVTLLQHAIAVVETSRRRSSLRLQPPFLAQVAAAPPAAATCSRVPCEPEVSSRTGSDAGSKSAYHWSRPTRRARRRLTNTLVSRGRIVRKRHPHAIRAIPRGRRRTRARAAEPRRLAAVRRGHRGGAPSGGRRGGPIAASALRGDARALMACAARSPLAPPVEAGPEPHRGYGARGRYRGAPTRVRRRGGGRRRRTRVARRVSPRPSSLARSGRSSMELSSTTTTSASRCVHAGVARRVAPQRRRVYSSSRRHRRRRRPSSDRRLSPRLVSAPHGSPAARPTARTSGTSTDRWQSPRGAARGRPRWARTSTLCVPSRATGEHGRCAWRSTATCDGARRRPTQFFLAQRDPAPARGEHPPTLLRRRRRAANDAREARQARVWAGEDDVDDIRRRRISGGGKHGSPPTTPPAPTSSPKPPKLTPRGPRERYPSACRGGDPRLRASPADRRVSPS